MMYNLEKEYRIARPSERVNGTKNSEIVIWNWRMQMITDARLSKHQPCVRRLYGWKILRLLLLYSRTARDLRRRRHREKATVANTRLSGNVNTWLRIEKRCGSRYEAPNLQQTRWEGKHLAYIVSLRRIHDPVSFSHLLERLFSTLYQMYSACTAVIRAHGRQIREPF